MAITITEKAAVEVLAQVGSVLSDERRSRLDEAAAEMDGDQAGGNQTRGSGLLTAFS